MTILAKIFAPLDAPEAAPPSPDVKFAVDDVVHLHKLGWCGSIRIAEIRGEHVRADGVLRHFDQDRAVWFHHKELATGATCTCVKDP